MLCRNKHGALSLSRSSSLFKIFTSSFLSRPRSSNGSPNFTNPNFTSTNPNKVTTKRRPISLTTHFRYVHNDLLPQTSQILDSDVNSICSLLSDQTLQTTSIDDLLKRFKERLSSKLVEQVLMNYRQLGRVRTLEFFSWAGLQMGFRFDDCVIEYMADFFGRRKLFDDLKCLLVTVSTNNGRVSCRTFSICIRFLGRQGRVREALCLFEEMETGFKCKPNNLVYNNMLYVLCKKETSGDLIDIAFSIFRRIKSPDTYSYSNILVGLCKFRRFETALEVFHEMGKTNLVPTRSAVNILIGELCLLSAKEGAIEKVRVNDFRRPFTILVPNVGSKSGAIEPATRVFWAVHEKGLLPSAFVVKQLILELCRLGNMREAVEILKVVEERKLACVQESYLIVIQGLCEHRWVEEACNLFGRMLSQGFKPKLVVYNCMICMLSKVGRLDDAERVFEIMNKNRCLPDNVTYTALIHAHGEVRNWEAAYGLLMEMLGLNWCPHFHTYSLVDKLLKEYGRLDLSIKLEGKLETQILHKHCKLGQLEEAYEKLRTMLEKGYYPPIYIRDSFERAFQKFGKWNIAHELLEKFDEVGKPEEAEVKS
ncbi:hypothetical protein L1049_016602 [Liquidambar formosana]|uniref:Pentatricopeptide repeat-containing protein n=1 Tax=Liquidambar formosana TaxID=63359 RepID=A0AAP0S6P7_LIQFO